MRPFLDPVLSALYFGYYELECMRNCHGLEHVHVHVHGTGYRCHARVLVYVPKVEFWDFHSATYCGSHLLASGLCVS